MKNAVKWIVLIGLLIGIIWGASYLYQRFSADYEPPSNDAPPTENTHPVAPDFTVLDKNGQEVSLSDFRGQPVVLNFWATWCGYCKMEMPDFERAFATYPDVQFLMVNATDGVRETVDIAKQYIEQEGYTFPVYYDVNFEAVSSFYVRSFPSTYFIDADGRLIRYQTGMLTQEGLEEGIRHILPKK